MQNRKIKILFSTFNVQKIGRFLFPILVIIFSVPAEINAKGGEEATKLVVRFGNYLNSWSRNPDDIEARDGLKAICNDGYGMRVADRLALEKCTTTDDNTILLGSYLRIFEDRHNEKIDYIIYNPKVEEVATKYAMDNTNIISVVADVEVKSASLNYMMKNVFYIKDNKICFIGDYAKETAQNERIDISKLNCPLWLSDTIVEADWNNHSIDIIVKSNSNWSIESVHKSTSWLFAHSRWYEWNISKSNDSTLHIAMNNNYRVLTHVDSVFITTDECKRKIKITQYGHNFHRASINNCFLEHKNIHVDFDVYNDAIPYNTPPFWDSYWHTKFYVEITVRIKGEYVWGDVVSYEIVSGEHLHPQNFRMKIPHECIGRGEYIEIVIKDYSMSELAKKVISIK